MAKLSCLFVLLFVLSVKSASSEPNIQLSLTNKGLNYVNKVLVNNLVKHVQGLTIPQITVQSGISLTLYKTSVHRAQLKSASFGVNNGFLQLEIHMNQLTIKGRYVSRGFWWLGGRGRFTASMSGLDLIQRLSIGHNDKGQPVATTAGCMAKISVSSYRFDQSFLLSVVSNLAKRSFQPMVERKICDAVSKAIQKKGKILPTLYPETHPLPGLACSNVSYPITKKPMVEKDYVDFLITGEVISTCRPSNHSSGSHEKFVRFVPNKERMLSISLSDDFFNLLLHRYYELNSLSIQAVAAPIVQTTSNGSVLSFKTSSQSFESELLFQEQGNKISAKLINLRAHPKTPLQSKANRNNALKVSKINILMNKINASLRDLVPLPLMDVMNLVNQTIVYQQGRVTLEMDIQV